MGFPEPARPTFSVSPEDRETIFEDLWNEGSGFRFLFGGFSDIFANPDANREAIKFIHRKIHEIVKDEKKAAPLISSDFFARRPLTDDKYYARFAQDNVAAVDLKKTPIESITPTGIKTSDGTEYPLDLIVFATGFDSVEGSHLRINFRGQKGKVLKDYWADGPKTYLGAESAGFPNLFFVNGPGAAFANNPPVSEEGARFAASLIAHSEELRKRGVTQGTVSSTEEADNQWRDEINKVSDATLFSKTPSWFYGQNVPGKHVAARFYFGGLAHFRALLAESRAKGFPGFKFA